MYICICICIYYIYIYVHVYYIYIYILYYIYIPYHMPIISSSYSCWWIVGEIHKMPGGYAFATWMASFGFHHVYLAALPWSYSEPCFGAEGIEIPATKTIQTILNPYQLAASKESSPTNTCCWRSRPRVLLEYAYFSARFQQRLGVNLRTTSWNQKIWKLFDASRILPIYFDVGQT